jgi:hypothetical protein
VLTDLAGELEPCGCSRASLGGLDRLAVELSRARSEGVPTLFVLAGALLFDPTLHTRAQLPVQERWEAEALADLLRELRADAAMPAASDVALWGDDLQRLERPAGPVWLLGAQPAVREALPRSAQRTLGGLRIALVGAAFERAAADAVQLSDLRRAVAAQRADGASLVIALLSGPRDRLLHAAREGGADLSVGGGDLRELPELPKTPRDAPLLEAGRRGQ